MINCEREDRYGDDEPIHFASDGMGFLDIAMEGWQLEDAHEEKSQKELKKRDELIVNLASHSGNFVEKTIILPALASSGTIFS